MDWSNSWKSSKQPRKQKKYARNAPKHVRGKQLSSHLSPALRKKHGMRSIRLRKGDGVKVMVGTFRGKTGKVDRIDTKRQRAYVTGVELLKKDGSKTMYPVRPSNLMIEDLELSDKKRIKEKASK